MVGSLEQMDEFRLSTLVAKTGATQGLPAVKVILRHFLTKTPSFPQVVITAGLDRPLRV